MQPIGDLMLDRKRLKQQITSWRALALLGIFAATGIYFSGAGVGNVSRGGIHTDYIAQVTLEGIMVDDPDRDEILDDLRDNKQVKAVIVKLDSPGGTTVAGEVAYLKLKEIAAKKPVVGVMNTLCASACYMAALGTNHIIARNGTLTGSIGVLLQSLEISRLTDKLGITPITITSGPMKDVPSMTEPFTPEQRRVVSELVTDAYDHFIGLIVISRKMNEAQVRTLADGRVYTGSQAAKLKLIDQIGGIDEARHWLEATHKISKDLKIKEIKAKPEFESVWEELGQATGIKIFNARAVGLDGLVSIWHPSIAY
jgi:protease-4